MKKLLFGLAFIFLVMSGVFVYASNVESYYQFEKGWNLVYGFTSPERLSGGEVISENIKAVYILKQPTQEFVRIYPNPETKKLEGIQDSYYEKTAQFVYSDVAGRSEYLFEEPLPPTYWNEHQIYKGWNLVGLSNYMVESSSNPDLTLEDIKGTCNIEKVYYFFDGKWVVFDYPEMDSTLLLKGLLIKVSNDCVLGMIDEESTVNPPPQIPN